MPDAGEGDPGRDVGLGELVALSWQGTWRFLVVAVREREPVGWVALACPPVYGYLAFSVTGSGWAALAGAAAPLVVVEVGLLVPLLLARAGWRGRRLLMERDPSGRAFVVAVPSTDGQGRRFWQLSNLIGLPAPGMVRPVERALRPGARLVRHTVREARRLEVGVRLVAADGDVARKVYEPAGFVYDDPSQPRRRQPHMHLPTARAGGA